MDKRYGHCILDLSRSIRRYIDYSFSSKGLTGHQARVLRTIYEKSLVGVVFQKDVEKIFDVRRSTMTSSLQALESLGYIKRVHSETDARAKVILITQSGIEASEFGKQIIDKTEEMIINCLSEEELSSFIATIKKIKSNFIEREQEND